MKVKLVKPFRYGMRIFEAGEIGEVVEVKGFIAHYHHPLFTTPTKCK